MFQRLQAANLTKISRFTSSPYMARACTWLGVKVLQTFQAINDKTQTYTQLTLKFL